MLCFEHTTKYFRKKHYLIMSMFMYVEGASIHACWRSGCHLIAFKNDSKNFYAILAPLRDTTKSFVLGGMQTQAMARKDEDEPESSTERKFCLSA